MREILKRVPRQELRRGSCGCGIDLRWLGMTKIAVDAACGSVGEEAFTFGFEKLFHLFHFGGLDVDHLLCQLY